MKTTLYQHGKITLLFFMLLFLSAHTEVKAVCNVPTGLSTTNITMNSAKLNWAATACDSFLVRYNVTGSTTYLYKTVKPGTSTTTTITGLYPSTTYSWVIHTYCSGGASGAYQTPATFTTSVGTVSCVIPNMTTTTSIASNSALLSWNTNVTADSFMVRYNVTGTTAYTWVKVPGSAHSYNMINLLPNTSYTWCVRCMCAASPTQSYSVTNTFVTLSSNCGVVDPYYFGTTGITAYAATISWKAITGALSYNIRYGVRYSNVWSTTSSTTISKALSGLSPTTWYEFQIQTVCSSGASAWSTSGIFQTTSAALALARGPYLNLSTQSSIYVRWRTNNATDSKVKFGTASTNLNLTATDATVTTEHVVKLTGLATNTKYFYSVGSSTTTLQGDTGNYFTTNPTVGSTGAVRIWAIGDFGVNSVAQKQVRDAYRNYTGSANTNIWLWLGDNAYADGTDLEYSNNVFGVYPYQMKNKVIWPATGNHDLHTANATNQTGPYFDAFTLPTAGEAGGRPSGTEAYYSFNYANIHFICLESTDAVFRATTGAMATWLTADLAANTQRWTVVYFHHPPYSKGSHDSDAETELLQMRTNIIPILESYKVDLVLSGHSHSYERSMMLKGHFGIETSFNAATMAVNSGSGVYPSSYVKTNPFNGTVYVVCGVSGQVGASTPGWPHNAMYFSSLAYFGSLVIDVVGDRLDCKFLTSAGAIADQFTIQKNGATPPANRLSDDEEVVVPTVSVYPNPAHNDMSVVYSTSNDGETTIQMADVTGRIVYEVSVGQENAGDHTFTINRDENTMPAGIYLIKVSNGDEVKTTKVVVED